MVDEQEQAAADALAAVVTGGKGFPVSASYAARMAERERCEEVVRREVCARCGTALTVANNPAREGWPSTRCGRCNEYDPESVPTGGLSLRERYRRGLSVEAAALTAIDVQTLDRQLRKEVGWAEAKGERADIARMLLQRLEAEMNQDTNVRALTVQQGPQTPQAVIYSPEEIELIKKQIAPGVSDLDLSLFIATAQRRGLDPFARQIYAILRRVKVDDKWETRMVMQTGIDGYRLIAARSGKYAGSDRTVFGPMVDDNGVAGKRRPEWAETTVWKVVQGKRSPFTAQVFWEERVQTTRDGTPNAMWSSQPRGQLAKCSEAAALRKGFPEEMSGLEYGDARLDTTPELLWPDELLNEYLDSTAVEIGDTATADPDTGELFDGMPQEDETEADELPATTTATAAEHATPAQLNALGAVALRKGWSETQLQEAAFNAHGAAALQDLTREQAGDLLRFMQATGDTDHPIAGSIPTSARQRTQAQAQARAAL